jgi:hypothetical protein
MTVTSRVKEFEHTPSAMLTLDQFNTVELDSEADPPVYTRNKFLEVINTFLWYFLSLRHAVVSYFAIWLLNLM